MPTPPRRADPLAAARAGDLDALESLASESLIDAYKWLLVAADFGHEEALDRVSDLEEHYDTFRHDDDGFTRAAIHLELASSYLTGADGLPVDHALAERHLDQLLGGDTSDVRALRARLDGAARRFVETWLDTLPFRTVTWRVDRLRRLWELDRGGAQIPVVIIDGELEALRSEVDGVHAAMRERR